MKAQSTTDNANLARIEKTIQDFPPFPTTLTELSRHLQEMSPIVKIQETIERDPALAVGVLRLARSAYYARRRPVETVRDAIIVLGQRQLLEVCTVACLSQVVTRKIHGYDLTPETFLAHSVATALTARLLAQCLKQKQLYSAYTCGLLHDIGMLVMFSGPLATIRQADSQERLVLERARTGIDHATAGAMLARTWKLPPIVVTAIECHHEPQRARQHRIMAAIVYAANRLASHAGYSIGAPLSQQEINFDPVMHQIGLRERHIEPLLKTFRESMVLSVASPAIDILPGPKARDSY